MKKLNTRKDNKNKINCKVFEGLSFSLLIYNNRHKSTVCPKKNQLPLVENSIKLALELKKIEMLRGPQHKIKIEGEYFSVDDVIEMLNCMDSKEAIESLILLCNTNNMDLIMKTNPKFKEEVVRIASEYRRQIENNAQFVNNF